MKTFFTFSLVLVSIIGTKVFAQAGTLDTTFSHNGKTVVGFLYGGIKGMDKSDCMTIQSDGKIVMGGYSNATSSGSYDFIVMRLNIDGTFDHSFNGKGYLFIDFLGYDNRAYGIGVQSDGKIVIAGTAFNDNGHSEFAVARLLSTGVLDNSFGSDGKVTTDLGDDVDVSSLAIQSDQKIVVAGTDHSSSNQALCALLRYKTDGSLDGSFGSGGKSITLLGNNYTPNCITIQSDGKILAGCGSYLDYNSEFVVARFTLTGLLDGSFGVNGLASAQIGSNNYCTSIAIQSSGKIIAGGCAELDVYNPTFALMRFTKNGKLDNTFGVNGITTTSFYSSWSCIYGLAIQSDDKILAAGYSQDVDDYSEDFAIVRYNKKGSLDQTFNGTGEVFTDFGGDETAYAIKIQSDGKIVACGTENEYTSNANICVARYHGDQAAPEKSDNTTANAKLSSDNIIQVIYPNPVNDVLHVIGLNPQVRSSIVINNISGTIVKSFSVEGSEYDCKVEDLPVGLYVIVINSMKATTYKFIKD